MSYSIGIDFGTASGRVILADTSTDISYQDMRKTMRTELI